MLFNSIEFLIFFPLVSLLYFISSFKYRVWVLLIASCIFYMYFIPIYILILLFTILVDYIAGISIENAKNPDTKKLFLISSLIANIGILAFFKYINFFIENTNSIFSLFQVRDDFPLLNIILPIGLSFHTFQAMSYTIEVYRGNYKAERNPFYYALYVLYYPQLVAGPIERPQHVLDQLHQKHDFDAQRILSGLRLIVWGLFKKVVIADRLALVVNLAYSDPGSMDGIGLLGATYFFSLQIYCDFSGYSDIALGASRIMGIELMQNFKTPYFSTSISSFWKRWHISLSSWFRDYLYISLGGNKTNAIKWVRNILIVFLLSGFWHGANWTFVIWGLLHGVYLLGEKAAGSVIPINNKWFLFTILKTILVFHLVTFAWIFFRATGLSDALLIIGKIYTSILGNSAVIQLISLSDFFLSDKITLFLIGFLFLSDKLIDFNKKKFSVVGNYLFFIAVLLAIVVLGQSQQEQFIYFQF